MLKTKKLRGSTKKKIGILIGLCVAFVVLQVMTALGMIGYHIQGLFVPMCYNIILAVSLNLTVGVLGELSLGHAGFMCIGSFVGAFFSSYMETTIEQWWLRFLIGLILGGVIAGLFGLLIGFPVLRLSGDYLAIVTLAFGEIIWNLCQSLVVATDANGLHFRVGGTIDNLDPATAKQIVNGPQGIAVPRFPMQDDKMFIIGFILVIITVFITLNFIHCRTGRAVKSIRDNRIAAESIGINITKYKLIVLVVSAFFAGIAGVLYSQQVGFFKADQATYGYPMSINILVFVVLGGMGSTLGSIIGAVVLTFIPEWLRTWTFLQEWFGIDPVQTRMLLYAIILIVVMMLNHSEKFQNVLAFVKQKLKSLLPGNKAKGGDRDGANA